MKYRTWITQTKVFRQEVEAENAADASDKSIARLKGRGAAKCVLTTHLMTAIEEVK